MSDQILQLLPLACKWIEEQENFILANGIPLSEDQQIDAHLVGVSDPRKVRLLKVAQIPFPSDPTIQSAMEETGMLTTGSIGLSLRYGIFLRDDHWQDRRVIVHELTHTMQYERMGGIVNFLRQYIEECITHGYFNSPMETEARETERRITQR